MTLEKKQLTHTFLILLICFATAPLNGMKRKRFSTPEPYPELLGPDFRTDPQTPEQQRYKKRKICSPSIKENINPSPDNITAISLESAFSNCLSPTQSLKPTVPEDLYEYAKRGDKFLFMMIFKPFMADIPLESKTHPLTPLHIASWYGHINIVETLIPHTKNINERVKHGELKGLNAFELACDKGHVKIARMLAPHSIESNTGAMIGFARQTGLNQILNAIKTNDYEKYQDALAKGANINGIYNDGSTPLHQTAFHARLKILKNLLSRDDLAKSVRNAQGKTALDIAVERYCIHTILKKPGPVKKLLTTIQALICYSVPIHSLKNNLDKVPQEVRELITMSHRYQLSYNSMNTRSFLETLTLENFSADTIKLALTIAWHNRHQKMVFSISKKLNNKPDILEKFTREYTKIPQFTIDRAQPAISSYNECLQYVQSCYKTTSS